MSLPTASASVSIINKITDLLNPPIPTTVTTVTGGQTTQTPKPTTLNPGQPCADCYPDQANLLLILDASKQDPNSLSQQLVVANQLSSAWNHFERTSLAYFGYNLVSVVNYEDLTPNDGASFQLLINATTMLNDPPNMVRALKQALGIIPRPKFGPQHVIFFTTSSDNEQIMNAVASAQALQKLGSVTVIGVGLANQYLGQLASPNDLILWQNLSDTSNVVNQIMGTLPHGTPPTQGPTTSTTKGMATSGITSTVQPIMTSSSVPGSTITLVTGGTSSPSPAPDCNVDIAMILDASDALSDTDFFLMNQFLAYNLTANWYINPFNGSEAGVFLTTDSLTFNEQGYFEFNNQADLAYSIMQHAGLRFGDGSSIANGLKSFDSILYNNHNRQGFGTVILQITYASAIDDIKEAYKILQSMKAEYNINYILVGVGPNITNDIFDLTEFTLQIQDFKDPKLADRINALICQKSPLTVTFPATTTQLTQGPVTSGATVPTSPLPYIPEKEAILFVLDASVDASNGLLDEEKVIVANMVDEWTHFERIGLASYADSLTYIDWIQYYNSKETRADFVEKLDAIAAHRDKVGNVSAGLHHTHEAYVPVDIQRVVFFTTTKNPDDFKDAVYWSNELQAMGSVTVVGMNMNDTDLPLLQTISSPGAAVNVPAQFTVDQIAQQIEQTLSSKFYSTTIKPTGITQQLTSSAAQQTTTFVDYEPEDADIVIVIDASMNCTQNLFDEKTLIQDLVTTRWTHFERVGLATYATTAYSQWMDYNDPHNSYDVFMEKLDDLPIHLDQTGSVAKSVKRLTFNLCKKYLAL